MTRGVKTKLTDEQWEQMGQYALEGCQNGTIEGLMGIADQTIHDNKDIREFLRQKRCERKHLIREAQMTQIKTPVMAIWLGKNDLGQTDRTDHNVNVKFEPIKVDMG